MKQKASKSHKGKIFTEEHKKHLSEGQKGLKRLSQRVKIVQLDLKGNVIKIWNSTKEASECTGIPESTIKGSINEHKKSKKGFIWKRN